MKKFVVIDHSLCNLQGHHYECSISVAEAAKRADYQPIILANKSFFPSLMSGDIPIIPVFEMDWFNNPTGGETPANQTEEPPAEKQKNWQETWQYQQYIWNNKYPQLSLFLEKVEGSLGRLYQWIQEDVKLLRSIPLSNTIWGLLKIIWGLIFFVLKLGVGFIDNNILKRDSIAAIPPRKIQSFTESLAQVLPTLNLTDQDHILIHTFGIEQLEELYYSLENSDRPSLPTYHLLFRRDTEEPLVTNAKGIGLQACLQKFYASQLWPNKIRFYTDTEDLVRKHNALSSVKVHQVPIPFRQEKLQLEQPKVEKDFIHLVYLGDARSEKGYQHLPQLVAGLWNDYLRIGKVKFTIQSNYNSQVGELEILEAKLNLCQYPSQKVKLIDSPMSPDDYYQLLASADIVILPYNPQNYQRTSGVLTESLAAGKPVVVPANSWLAQQVDETRASIYENPRDLTQAVIRLLQDLPTFTQSAQEFSVNWRSQQSPDYFLQCLLKSAVSEPQDIKQELIASQQIAANILVMLDGSWVLQGRNLEILTYFNQCGYQVYGIFYTSESVFDVDALQQHLSHYGLQRFWVLTDKSQSINAQNFPSDQYQEYLDNCYYQRSNLRQDLMDASRLLVPDNLIETVKYLPIDLVYTDSVFCGQYLEKLGLDRQKTILHVAQLSAYTQALRDKREIDSQEFDWEIAQLKTYPILVTDSEPFAERLQELTDNPQVYAVSYSFETKNINYFALNQVCQTLLGNKAWAITSFKPNPKIAILYPWGDIQERRSGASQRTGLVLDYLQQSGYETRLYTLGQGRSLWSEGVYYEYYEPYFEQAELVKKVYQDAYQTWDEDLKLISQDLSPHSIEAQEHWLPWIYYQFRFDANFKNWLEKITDWADVVILEYPFWGYLLGEICQRKKVQFLLTAHDVLAKNLSLTSRLGQIALGEELKALKRADRVITLTPEDQAFFANYDVKSCCIPIAIDTQKIQSDSDSHNSSKLATILGIAEVKVRPICLFVGSQHRPNVEAVKQIKQWSETRSLNFDFVIVGSCWSPEHRDNFIALGKVSADDLITLYRQSALILAPLTEGTGMSVKTLEALAYGKVMLGTAIAFRGYPVESGVNCLLCDHLEDYPDKINQLIKQPDLLEKIGQQAKEFSLAYDYRQLYETYLDLIDGKFA